MLRSHSIWMRFLHSIFVPKGWVFNLLDLWLYLTCIGIGFCSWGRRVIKWFSSQLCISTIDLCILNAKVFLQVPHLDMYLAKQQLHRIHAQHIRNEWQWQQHPRENGWLGACYIVPGTGRHIGLNMQHTSIWAAEMVWLYSQHSRFWFNDKFWYIWSRRTKYAPPNVPEFDGASNGSSSLSQPHGHTSPSSQANVTPTVSMPIASTSADQATQFMTAFQPQMVTKKSLHFSGCGWKWQWHNRRSMHNTCNQNGRHKSWVSSLCCEEGCHKLDSLIDAVEWLFFLIYCIIWYYPNLIIRGSFKSQHGILSNTFFFWSNTIV